MVREESYLPKQVFNVDETRSYPPLENIGLAEKILDPIIKIPPNS
jgi:hypothetical protein